MKNALLVLDLQKDFIGTNARFPIARHQVTPILEAVNHLIEKANSTGELVIYIGNEFKRSQFISNWFRKNAAMAGSTGASLDERLLVKNDIYFSKRLGDAFSNPKLCDYLKKMNAENIIITGVFAEGCVRATAMGAKKKGFKATVVEDAIGGASDNKNAITIKRLQKAGVSIVNSSSLF